MPEPLKCTRILEVIDRNAKGQVVWRYHQQCGEPAAEVEVGGMLISVKAVLCTKHRIAAQKECQLSKRGYRMGRINKDDIKDDPEFHQEPLPGTGLLP